MSSQHLSLQPSLLPIAKPAALVLVLLLSACGSGSGDTPPVEPTPIEISEQLPGEAIPDPGETSVPGMDDEPMSIETNPDNDETSVPIMDDVDIVNVDDPTQCNQATQNQWAYNSMQDFYLFYDQVPVVDPRAYESADELVRDVRFQERDDFSNVSDATTSSLAFEAGREFGLGFGLQYDQADAARISYVFTDSPIGRAGIERGDIIISVNGVAWLDALGPDLFNAVVGTPENPSTASWQFQRADTAELVDVELTAAEYDINTVIGSQIITNDSLQITVGYLVFNRFLSTSEPELRTELEFFRENNITELVLDLRYNGGGLVFIAQGLASAIGGESLAGQPLYEYRFNDRYTENNETLTFFEGLGDLNLSRLIVLTSEQTASASEIVIAGLQPYMDVVTIGTRTAGKPYVSFSNDRCGERLNAMEAEGFNASGVSVFGGISATCFAEDDLSQNFGFSSTNGAEGQLGAGLNYIADGSCPAAPVISAARQTDRASVRDEHMHFGYGLTTVGGAIVE